jgi:hypothetical protein
MRFGSAGNGMRRCKTVLVPTVLRANATTLMRSDAERRDEMKQPLHKIWKALASTTSNGTMATTRDSIST